MWTVSSQKRRARLVSVWGNLQSDIFVKISLTSVPFSRALFRMRVKTICKQWSHSISATDQSALRPIQMDVGIALLRMQSRVAQAGHHRRDEHATMKNCRGHSPCTKTRPSCEAGTSAGQAHSSDSFRALEASSHIAIVCSGTLAGSSRLTDIGLCSAASILVSPTR